jgi:pimeloyl-ACP methyl ester carboxylesterase
MSLFVLIPGAGGAAWYWHRVVPELRARGHEAVAVDLPGADESAGLPEYADAVVAAIGAHRDVVVVAQSMGGFTGPVACTRTPVRLLVLVNAMAPLPGETPGDWWDHTGWEPARVAAAQAAGYPAGFDPRDLFPARRARGGRGRGGGARLSRGGHRLRPTLRHRAMAGCADPDHHRSGRPVLPA